MMSSSRRLLSSGVRFRILVPRVLVENDFIQIVVHDAIRRMLKNQKIKPHQHKQKSQRGGHTNKNWTMIDCIFYGMFIRSLSTGRVLIELFCCMFRPFLGFGGWGGLITFILPITFLTWRS
jgi:hypothetical protein